MQTLYVYNIYSNCDLCRAATVGARLKEIKKESREEREMTKSNRENILCSEKMCPFFLKKLEVEVAGKRKITVKCCDNERQQ